MLAHFDHLFMEISTAMEHLTDTPSILNIMVLAH